MCNWFVRLLIKSTINSMLWISNEAGIIRKYFNLCKVCEHFLLLVRVWILTSALVSLSAKLAVRSDLFIDDIIPPHHIDRIVLVFAQYCINRTESRSDILLTMWQCGTLSNCLCVRIYVCVCVSRWQLSPGQKLLIRLSEYMGYGWLYASGPHCATVPVLPNRACVWRVVLCVCSVCVLCVCSVCVVFTSLSSNNAILFGL